LIDLPGYIQVTSASQPVALKSRIRDLCKSYISRENVVVLAVCPADVDLANCEALMEARGVDSKGDRTIGVISKLDLVDPSTGRRILGGEGYKLNLGWIGVSTRGVKGYDGFDVGIDVLRKRLVGVLEGFMGRSVEGLTKAVSKELGDARYHLKVQYNDRRISAESYSKCSV
jgi:hypothetical protein